MLKTIPNFFCVFYSTKISTRFFSRFQLKWQFLIKSRPVITFNSNNINNTKNYFCDKSNLNKNTEMK